jgi:hypothetical protein
MVDNRRRTLLKTAGGVVIVGTLAGCAGNGEGEPNESSDNGSMDGGENGNETNGAGGGETDGNETDENETEDNETDDESEPAGEAALRVAHLSPDAPNVDVYVAGDAVLEDVPFRTVSDYLELPPGDYPVEITAAGDAETVVFDEELTVPEGQLTAAAIGELADENQPFAVEVYEDDLYDPGEDARVRLLHAAPDAPNVDVTVDGETLFENVEFGATRTVEIPPDDYTLEVRPATSNVDGEVVATFDIAPEAGTVYTAFAVGYLEPDAAPADESFDLEVVEDGP